MEMGRIVAAVPETQRRAFALPWLAWALIAAAPLIFALSTWNPAQQPSPLTYNLLLFSFPVVAVECVVLLAALFRGAQPLAIVRAQPFWVRAALVALIALALGTAAFVAPFPRLAMTRTLIALIHLALGLSLASLFASRWRDAAAPLWPLVVLGICAFVALIPFYLAAIPDHGRFDWEHFSLGVSNVRQLGFYSAVGAAAALGLAVGARDRRAFAGWTLAASVMIALSFWSGTRSSLVGLAGAFVLGIALLPALRSVRFLAAASASVALGALLSLLYPAPSPVMGLLRTAAASTTGGAEEVSSGRLGMWEGTVDVILRSPFFGHGAGQFRWIVPESAGRYNHPHNLFLQVLVEWGAAGALLVFSLAGWLWWRFHRAVSEAGPKALPAWLVVNCLIVYSMIEGALYHPWPIMMATIAFALVLGRSARRATA